MIAAREANLIFYCKDYTLIENYEEAVNDKEYMWELHHRDEIRELPSGMVALRSIEYLKLWGLYYHRPADELIFLRYDKHMALHRKYRYVDSSIKTNMIHRCKKHATNMSQSYRQYKANGGELTWNQYQRANKEKL